MAVEEMAHAAGEAAPHAEGGIHVALAAQRLGDFFGIPITNTVVTTWLLVAIMVTLAVVFRNKIALIPGKFQTLLELVFEFVYDYVAETLGSREMARRFFPLLMTIFLFVLVLNWFEFLPGVESIKYHGEPLFRGVNTDLTTPLMLAIVSFLVIEITGIATMGFITYGKKFFVNPFKNPIGFAVGLIELIGEFVRLISLSFRLFGNILAGSIIIAVAVFFAPYGVPALLSLFEVFIGFLQAAIFALLTLFFIKLAIEEPHGEEAH
ncbi:MAG TPA: F0F1 ATP synthase subunit A [Candidatus Paceibacterota bacterium]|nr:F0F1 ATP synthase subunit A [Candidatus Paceibacterota bacterium]